MKKEAFDRREPLVPAAHTGFAGNEKYALIDGLPMIVWIASPDIEHFWFNQKWYDYSGAKPQDMEEWAWQDYHRPDEISSIVSNFYAALESGQVWEDVLSLRRRDGVYRWFLSRAAPVRDDKGDIVRWIGCYTDIDDCVRAGIVDCRKLKNAVPAGV